MNFSATLLTLLCAAQASGAPIDLAQDVAAWRADELTRDDGPKALESLRALVAKAETELAKQPESQELRSLLAGLYRTELDGLAKRGRKREMADRLIALLELAHGPRDGKSAEALAAASAGAIDAQRIRTVLAPLSSLMPDSTKSGTSAGRARDEILAAAVEEALATGETEVLGQIGPAAAPALASIARGQGGPDKDKIEQNALRFLSTIEPTTALDVALELTSQGDVLLKSRVIAAFEATPPFASPQVWRAAEQPGRYELRNPAWAQIIPGLLKAPGVPAELTHPMVTEFIARDFAPEGYGPLIEAALQARRWDNAKLKGHGHVLPEVARDAAARVISRWSPDQSVTANLLVAASAAMRAQDASMVYSLAATTNLDLRRVIVDAWGPRGYSWVTEAGKAERARVQPTIDDAYLQGLDRLVRGHSDYAARLAMTLADDVAQETGQAVIPGPMLGAWIEADVEFAETSTALIWFRELVPHFQRLNPAARRDLMPRAAAWIAGETSDGKHRSQLVELLFQSTNDVPTLLDAANALKGASLPSEAGSGLAAAAKLRLAESSEGATAIIEWMGANGTLEHWQRFIEKARDPRGLTVHEPFLKGLSASDQKTIVRALWKANYDKFSWLDQDDVSFSRSDWFELLGDKGVTVDGARWVISEITDTQGDPLPAGAEKLFARVIAMIGESPEAAREYTEIGLDPEIILTELLSLPGVPDELLLNFYVPLQRRDLIQRVYSKFPRETWRSQPNSPLISSLITAIAAERNADYMGELIEGLHAGPMVQKSLARLLEYESSRIYLPLAEAMLSPSAPVELPYRKQALGYVASFLDGEAVEMLLAAARGARDPEFRDQIFAEVEKILAWQEAETKWRSGQGTAEKRSQAIVDLTRMLDDPSSSLSARVESIGGLALLGAVEEIPRLIRTMEEGPAAVRTAAKDALRQLRAAAEK